METAADIINNYRAVRSRLWGPPAKQTLPKVVLPKVRATIKPQRVDFEIVVVQAKQRHRLKVNQQGVFKKAVKLACARWGLPQNEVLGPGRKRRLVLARIDIIRDLHHAGWSYTRIGRRIGRDHSSVLHIHKKYTPNSDAYKNLVAAEERNPT